MKAHVSFLKTLINVPMNGLMVTWNSSPSLIVTFGFLTMPTPAGVPVRMTVPAGNVVLWERKLMSWGMENIMSL